jgi:hypothetical protein
MGFLVLWGIVANLRFQISNGGNGKHEVSNLKRETNSGTLLSGFEICDLKSAIAYVYPHSDGPPQTPGGRITTTLSL